MIYLADRREWRQEAACADQDPELFIGPDGDESPAARNLRERGAKAVCAECPVLAQCLTFALRTDTRFGVYGELGEAERLPLHLAERRRQQGTGEGSMTALDFEVLRNGRPVDAFQADADPQDIAWMQKRLQGWLTGNGWDKGLWSRFELVVREHGKNRQLAKVQAV